MIEDDIFNAFLDSAVEVAKKNIKDSNQIKIEDAIPLMLKSQYNHIAHLDNRITSMEKNMVTKEDFYGLKDQFTELKDQFTGLKEQSMSMVNKMEFRWIIGISIAFLALLQSYAIFFSGQW